MSDFAFLIAPLAAFFVAAASPGPATLAVAGAAMAQGRGAAIYLGLGLSISLAFWGGLVAAGLGPVLIANAKALLVLRIAGGAFLLWLAWGSARAALRGGEAKAAAPSPTSGRGMVLRGLALNGLNPKGVLAWAAVVALGVSPTTSAAEIWIITAACALLGAAIYLVYAVAFAAPAVRRAYRRGRRGVDALVALGFGAAGLRLIFGRGFPA